MTTKLKAVAAAAFAVAGLSITAAQAQDVTLRMAHIYTPGNIWYDAAEAYKQAVEERSEGAITIDIDHSGMTGDWPQAIEGLLIGTNDIVLQSVGTLDRYDTIAGIEAYPYLVRDLDHFKEVYFGDLGRELYGEIREKTGFKIIGAGYRGARHMTSSVEVRSVEDLEGVKLRVPPLRMYRMTWEMLGASPVPMGVDELFTSMQQGVVDGQENPLEIVESQKFDEVQDYVIETAHVIGAMTFIFNGDRFEQLPEDVQQVLQEEGDRVMLEFSDRMADDEQTLKEALQERGMEFIEVDRSAFQARLGDMPAEFPELADWVERIQASAE
ncbi:TRAP transporter substrate-binding protein [Aquibaculum sediminis]|uniref:TRAP transporter substrate-binding protein n=1 Tax=Aquibaculum sediminis TaxID=3231907 RepID=UPI0034541F9F